ncbi:MAG: RidA family protein [Phycisphaerae bacterium]|nr:RidA family protein [Phycisphaerae bacterium]
MPAIRDRLAELNLTLPKPAKPVASYIPAVTTTPNSRLVFIAGQVPFRDGSLIAAGSVPGSVSIEQAQECARQCVLNGLAALEAEIGDLAKLRRVVRLGVFVACEHGFTEHPKVANGASDLLVQLLGEAGKHARAAVGAPSLPLGAPVEVEFIFEVSA